MATAKLTVKLPDDFPEEALEQLKGMDVGMDEHDLIPILMFALHDPAERISDWWGKSEPTSKEVEAISTDIHRCAQLVKVIGGLTAYGEAKDLKRREERGRLTAVGS